MRHTNTTLTAAPDSRVCSSFTKQLRHITSKTVTDLVCRVMAIKQPEPQAAPLPQQHFSQRPSSFMLRVWDGTCISGAEPNTVLSLADATDRDSERSTAAATASCIVPGSSIDIEVLDPQARAFAEAHVTRVGQWIKLRNLEIEPLGGWLGKGSINLLPPEHPSIPRYDNHTHTIALNVLPHHDDDG